MNLAMYMYVCMYIHATIQYELTSVTKCSARPPEENRTYVDNISSFFQVFVLEIAWV